jgi:hypothetical protein
MSTAVINCICSEQTNTSGGKVGAWVQKVLEGRGEEGDDDTEIFYSRAGSAAAAPGAAFACSVIAGRHLDGLIDEHKEKF